MELLKLAGDDLALFEEADLYGYVCSSCGTSHSEIMEIEEYVSLDPFYFWLCRECLEKALSIMNGLQYATM